METQDTLEPVDAGAVDDTETLQAEDTEENVDTDGTSEDGQDENEDADQTDDPAVLRERLAAKDRHIERLEREKRTETAEKPGAKKAPAKKADPEDLTDWKILNSNRIQTAGKAYLDEVGFLKQHAVPLTPDTLERALSNAELRKGIQKNRSTRQQVDTAEVQIENRSPRRKQTLTESQRNIPGFKAEWLDEFPELARKK